MPQTTKSLFADGDFAGRVAFVTGAASGIGNGLARVLAGRGARLAIADVRADAIERAAHELRQTGGEVEPFVVDVADRAAMTECAAAVAERFGAVHLVINNAGIAQVGTPMDEVDEQTYRWMFDVNVHGVTNGMAAFAPFLRTNGAGGGHIVNVSSIAGLFLVPQWHIGLYSATKMAVIPLSLGMRLALSPSNIGVSVVCPGRIWSELRSNSAALSPSGGSLVSDLPDDIDENVMTAAHAAEVILHGVVNDRAFILPHPERSSDVAEYHKRIADEFEYWASALPDIPVEAEGSQS